MGLDVYLTLRNLKAITVMIERMLQDWNILAVHQINGTEAPEGPLPEIGLQPFKSVTCDPTTGTLEITLGEQVFKFVTQQEFPPRNMKEEISSVHIVMDSNAVVIYTHDGENTIFAGFLRISLIGQSEGRWLNPLPLPEGFGQPRGQI